MHDLIPHLTDELDRFFKKAISFVDFVAMQEYCSFRNKEIKVRET